MIQIKIFFNLKKDLIQALNLSAQDVSEIKRLRKEKEEYKKSSDYLLEKIEANKRYKRFLKKEAELVNQKLLSKKETPWFIPKLSFPNRLNEMVKREQRVWNY